MKKLVAVGALLAALVAGCGGVTSTPEDTGRSTMDAMAGGPGQAGKACDYYTATYAKSTTEDGEADSCEEAMTQGVILAKGFGIDFSDIEVGEAKMNGNTATVVTHSSMGKSTISLVKQNGEWLIDREDG
jgi:hypothetical protein